ncbi:unnamed protein product, partial [Brenthis ino]
MEAERFHSLLQATQEEIFKTREFYNLDEQKIKDFIDAIKEWCKKQEHLVEASKYLTHDIIERLICLSRGSLEGTKTKIDKLLTIRGLSPQIVANRSVEEFDDYLDKYAYIPLPKMDKEQTRVFVIKHLKENWADFDLLTYMRYCFLTVYGLRIKGIHVINAPAFVDLFVSIYKKVVSEKLGSRIYIHTSYETIYDYVSKEILPEDYGGDAPSVAKLQEQWREYLKSDEGRKVVEISNNLKSDESRRNCAKFNEEYLGMPGSFTKLNVD